MRDLTQEEIRDYLRFVLGKGRQQPADFSQEQAELIGTEFLSSGMMKAVTMRIVADIVAQPPENVESETVMLSLLVWAFQMGRECESRLLTLALQKRN